MSTHNIQAFLSYHTEDKEKAIIIKNELINIGIDCFLAPDDIVAGEKFREVLYKEIESCDVFIAIFSKNYHTSNYSDQELGIALGLKKSVIPFCIDDTLPYGFLDGTQCICSNNTDIKNKIPELANSILVVTDSGKEYVDLCIKNLSESNTWANAGYWAQKIENVSQFTTEQVTQIANTLLGNGQVSSSWRARPILVHILKNNMHILHPEERSHLGEFL